MFSMKIIEWGVFLTQNSKVIKVKIDRFNYTEQLKISASSNFHNKCQKTTN